MSDKPLHGFLDQLAMVRDVESRSISSENPTGAKGGGGRDVPKQEADGSWSMGQSARELGRGWKVHPCDAIQAGETKTLADVEGPGTIRQIWMTPAGVAYRDAILRIYWDGQQRPSVECPVGDFFGSAFTSFDVFAPIASLAVCVNPGNAFNCYWPMPFRKRCRVTLENRDPDQRLVIFYQINYELGEVAEEAAYFHAQFRRVNPLGYGKVYRILEGVRGRRDQVLPRRRYSPRARRGSGRGGTRRRLFSDDLRDGNGGLLLRFVQL
jgi:D-arabinan exo alpha-(1,3)/(1,5)-arabinofuranosidase (non-reducing end)